MPLLKASPTSMSAHKSSPRIYKTIGKHVQQQRHGYMRLKCNKKINRGVPLKCSRSEGLRFVLQQILPVKLAEVEASIEIRLQTEENSENIQNKCPSEIICI